MSGGPSSKPPLPPLPPRPPKPRPPGDPRPPNPRPPPPNPLPAGGLMVLCVGCGSCVSLFGERERAAKCPGRREACERARRCARRTRGEGKRSTDVLRVHQEELQLGLLVSGRRAPPGDFSQARTRSRLRHAHRSPRGRAARGEFPPWTVPLRVTPLRSSSTGRTHASTRLRRRAHLARSAKGPTQNATMVRARPPGTRPQRQARDATRAIGTRRFVTNARASSKRATRSNVTRTRAFPPAPATT